MKIASVATHVLCAPAAPHFKSAFSTFAERWACLVEITTECGLVGWGECLGPARPNAAIVAAMAGHLIGRDPRRIEPLWLELYDQFRDQGRAGLALTAQSGIDIALWDLLGKHHGAPIHALLGGAFRNHVHAYATGGFPPVEGDRLAALAAEIEARVADGFQAAKIKIGFGVAEDLAAIETARAVLGPDRRLMVDANHGYDAVEAAALGRRAERFDVAWFEEPVTPELLDAYVELRRSQPLPIAGGETWQGRAAFADAFARRAIDIVQPDICAAGGFTEMRKIAAMAETAGVRLVPHVWGTSVAIAAALQMIAALPPSPPRHAPDPVMLEFDRTAHAYRDAVATTPIVARDGVVAISDGPGLGIEVDRGVLQRFAAPAHPA